VSVYPPLVSLSYGDAVFSVRYELNSQGTYWITLVSVYLL
jgi:hypothetical protein